MAGWFDISCRLIEDQQQCTLLQTPKALETFKLSLSENDRTYLLNQDRLNVSLLGRDSGDFLGTLGTFVT